MQIRFVADKDDWNAKRLGLNGQNLGLKQKSWGEKWIDLLSFTHHINELLVDNLDDFERLLTCDRVDKNIPMEVHGILSWKYAVFILSSGVYEFHLVVGIVDTRYFTKCCREIKYKINSARLSVAAAAVRVKTNKCKKKVARSPFAKLIRESIHWDFPFTNFTEIQDTHCSQ